MYAPVQLRILTQIHMEQNAPCIHVGLRIQNPSEICCDQRHHGFQPGDSSLSPDHAADLECLH